MPAAIGKKFIDLTPQDIELLKREDLTSDEICKLTGIHPGPSITRWRKALGISVAVGSKLNVKKPWLLKQESRECPVCNKLFCVTPSSKKTYCSISCAVKTFDKSYMKSEEYRSTLRNPNLSEYKKYKNKVGYLTKKNYELYKEQINPNNYKRGLCGVEGAYQLDHIIPVKYGFENNIPEEIIASVGNLQMLPWKINLKKSSLHNE